MRFEWDDEKNAANIRKHSIDFADVPTIFSGPMLVERDERENYGEERWIGIGFLRNIVAFSICGTEAGYGAHYLCPKGKQV